MHVDDLHYENLLHVDPDGGRIHFAGQRTILIDAVAMGLLRKHLVENFGLAAARTVLTQFGFAQGWRMAASLGEEFEWETTDDWRSAGTRLHSLLGLFRPSASNDPLGDDGAVLLASYEAEQHVQHFGQSDSCVCWTICGMMSGYLSRTTGEDVFVLEDRCMGRGDDLCRLRGRSPDGWGAERQSDLACFGPDILDQRIGASLAGVMRSLKTAEDRLRFKCRVVKRPVEDDDDGQPPLAMVDNSPAMREVTDLARRLAEVDVTVVISGESGVGKERIARLIHAESARADKPFVAVNCAAVSESLLESELFGHKRGAFTGATADREGLFEAADGGTLLLDEIGDISHAMQVKLLRALQEREVRRVGESQNRSFDVRVLAATNRDLAEEVEAGNFRTDLFYRLRVVELHLPPLRERRADILPLARTLLRKAAKDMARKITAFSPAVADQLLGYSWPGNVRELKNVIDRSVALTVSRRVEIEDISVETGAEPKRPVPGEVESLDEIERDYILAVLALNEGSRAQTASQLEIGSSTLYRKLKAYDEA